MHKPTIKEILAPKSQACPRIYAYFIDDSSLQDGLTVYGFYDTVVAKE